MHRRARFLPLIPIIAIAGLGIWWWTTRVTPEDGALSASGTIETTEIVVSPELSGRVIDVLVSEGEHVEAGQELLRLDTTLLDRQRAQAEASLAAAQAQQSGAQANYDLLKAGAEPGQIAAAEEAVHAAEASVARAEAQLAQLLSGARGADIAAAEAALAAAQAQQKIALDAHDATMTCVDVPGPNGTQQVCPALGTREEQARAALEAANEAVAAAQQRLNQLKAGATKNELDAARAGVDAANAQQAIAQAQLDLIKNGTRREQLDAAQAQVDAAEAQVNMAQAAIDLLDAQIDKLTLRAPASGVVLHRAIEPGEVVFPGSTVLVLGDMSNLYINVFVPEDRYGQIDLGQRAEVQVDSFAGEAFAAQVTRIADRAEFTPRNVQTAEGRATTVFAIRLSVDNASGKLKPGMPADVAFDEQ